MNESMNDDHWIDRLADGELTPDERRALFARLDADPGTAGWRRCALALLEAQILRAALKPAAAVAEPKPRLVARTARRPLALVSAAAGLILAFTLGRAGREQAAAPGPAPTVVAVAKETARPTPLEPETVGAVETAEPLEAEWQRKGFEVERRRRTVSLSLEDGRTVAVPVNEVRFKYVGDRTY